MNEKSRHKSYVMRIDLYTPEEIRELFDMYEACALKVKTTRFWKALMIKILFRFKR